MCTITDLIVLKENLFLTSAFLNWLPSADTISGLIFALLPSNAVFMGISMYNLEHVSIKVFIVADFHCKMRVKKHKLCTYDFSLISTLVRGLSKLCV